MCRACLDCKNLYIILKNAFNGLLKVIGIQNLLYEVCFISSSPCISLEFSIFDMYSKLTLQFCEYSPYIVSICGFVSFSKNYIISVGGLQLTYGRK